MFRTILFSTSLIALGTGAFAGNLSEPIIVAPVEPVAPVVVAPPSADWTGFYAGLQYVDGTAEFDDNLADLESEDDFDGFGVHAGYLRDLGSFVLGGELDYDNIETDGGTDGDVVRLKGIAGYDLGAFMPYLTAGAANVDLEDIGSDTLGFYGLGGTYAFTDSIRAGAEYLVHEGDEFDGSDTDVDVDTLSLRVSFSF